jgi:hypothetical protein
LNLKNLLAIDKQWTCKKEVAKIAMGRYGLIFCVEFAN